MLLGQCFSFRLLQICRQYHVLSFSPPLFFQQNAISFLYSKMKQSVIFFGFDLVI